MSDDLKRYERALKAASEAGDVAGAQRIARAMRKLMENQSPDIGKPPTIPIGAEALPAHVKEVVSSSTKPEQTLAGIGAAPMIASSGVKGLFNISDPNNVAARRALAGATPYSMGGNIGGNVGMFGLAPARGIGLATAGLGKPMLAGRAGMVADTALTGGALNAATEPGDWRQRAMAGGLALAGSALTPGAYAAGAGTRRALTRGGKRVEVAETLRRELGDEGFSNLEKSLQGTDDVAGIGVRSSSAARTGEPALESLESGSRVARPDLWKTFDRANAEARWNALLSKAGTKGELELLEQARDKATGEIRQEALEIAEKSLLFAKSGDVTEPMLREIRDQLFNLKRGNLRPNKDVQALVKYIESELRQKVTPGQLYEMRKFLTDGIAAGSNDALKNAAKAARAQRMELVSSIDNILENLSGGAWKEYMTKYAAASGPVTTKKAMQRIAGDVSKGQPAGAVPTLLGESAAWKTLGRLRDLHGEKQFGSKTFDRLSSEDREFLELIIKDLKRQSNIMRGGTATIGSPTAGLLASGSRANNVAANAAGILSAKIPMGGMLTRNALDSLGRKAEEELAALLQSPEQLYAAIQAARRAQRMGVRSSQAGLGLGSGASDAFPY